MKACSAIPTGNLAAAWHARPQRPLFRHLVLLVALLTCASLRAGRVQILANGGFERDTWEWVSVWGHSGHRVVSDVSYAGASSMYFSRMGAIKTQRYQYRGGPVTVRGTYRMREVQTGERPYYRFWVQLNLFREDGSAIKHQDIVFDDGTCDWRTFEQTLTSLPADTAAFELSIALHNCTGELWLDDVAIEADATLGWPEWRYTEQPYYTGTVLPEPESSTYGEEIPIATGAGSEARTGLRVHLGGRPCRGAEFGADQIRFRLIKALRAIQQAETGTALPEEAVTVTVRLGKPADPHIREAAARLALDIPASLAPQEHMVRTVVARRNAEVIAIGGDDKGVAYAAASVVQMIGVRGGRLILRAFDLRDRPDVMLRASSDYMPLDPAYLSRLVLYKMSVYAMQHRSWWRQVGPDHLVSRGSRWTYEDRLEPLRDMVRRTGVIDLMMLVHIYVTGGRPVEESGAPFDIANPEHIRDLTTRLRWLYEQGVTIQMICVDDYTDREDGRYVCKTEAERERFGSVGRAHGYLMRQLWENLAADCPGLKLSIVPAPYSLQHLESIVSRESGIEYLAAMAEDMPEEVAVVWTGPRIVSAAITRDDWDAYARLVPNQPLYIWDNGQAGSPVPGYDVALFDEIDEASAWSLMYQNSHFVGWPSYLPAALCANDAMWDLDDYDPDRVHRTACGMAFGEVNYDDIATLNQGYLEGRRILTQADPDLDSLRRIVENVYAALDRLEAKGFPGTVPRRHLSSASVTPDVVRRFEWIPTVTVPRLETAPVLDGALDEAAWERAAVLSEFRHVKATPDAPMADASFYPTESRMLATQDALWIGCRVDHGETPLHDHENVGKQDASIFFNSDTIEVFLGTDPSTKAYVHLAVDHTGTRFDERRPDPGVTWDGAWEQAVRKDEKGVWTLELRIPFAALGVDPPTPGTVWKANVCRAFGQKSELSCWAPIYGSFHNWTFFGKLRFKADPP